MEYKTLKIEEIDLNKYQNIHFIGLLSPFALFCVNKLLALGKTVTASEKNQDSELAKEWIEKGVLLPGGNKAENITDKTDLVVVPNGLVPDNPELPVALEKNIDLVLLPSLVGVFSKEYKTIGVAGTHGKSTTTALIVWILHKTLGTPNFILGDAKDKIFGLDLNHNITKDSEYLVLEACEYKRQFIQRAPAPYISVITHIDLDHTDYYKDQDDYNSAFAEFMSGSQYKIVVDHLGKNEEDTLNRAEKLINKQLDDLVIKVDDLRPQLGHIECDSLYGNHNQENLLRAAAVGLSLGIEKDKVLQALKEFPGLTARFEFKGTTPNGVKVFRDYAHNPQKVKACIQGAKEAFPNKKLVVCYQPHNFERTATFKHELANALMLAETIIIPNIFSARETELEKSMITEEEFVNIVKETCTNSNVYYTQDSDPFTQTKDLALELADKDSIIVVVTAGNLDKIVKEMVTN